MKVKRNETISFNFPKLALHYVLIGGTHCSSHQIHGDCQSTHPTTPHKTSAAVRMYTLYPHIIPYLFMNLCSLIESMHVCLSIQMQCKKTPVYEWLRHAETILEAVRWASPSPPGPFFVPLRPCWMDLSQIGLLVYGLLQFHSFKLFYMGVSINGGTPK